MIPLETLGSPMIRDIEIHNFRCFKSLRIESCSRINLIVGDNGVGKTALLEAIFLTLSGGIEVANRLRMQRGNDSSFASGTAKSIEASMWRPFFYDFEWNDNITITIKGDMGDSRSLMVSRSPAPNQYNMEFQNKSTDSQETDESTSAPLVFSWVNANGRVFPYTSTVSLRGIDIPGAFEYLPNYFHIPAGQTIGAIENADRFASLRRMGRHDEFVRLFKNTYEWIDDIGLDVQGGAPIISVSINGSKQIFPITNISGAINRLLSVLLSVASRDRSVVVIDEVENGIYYKHLAQCWQLLLDFARKYNSQLFMTTHSLEWINALFSVCGDDNDDISIWRLERSDTLQPKLITFSGDQIKDALDYGTDPRGADE